jgi:hypothetical protein
MNDSSHNLRVLSVDPYDRGLAFAVFEGPERLIDWGSAHRKRRNLVRYSEFLKKLIARYVPDILITENGVREGSSRTAQTRAVLKRLVQLGRRKHLRVRTYSRDSVEDVFGIVGASHKHEIAGRIADWFPELAPRLPGPRRDWTGEARSMNIFDAVSFALAFFHHENIHPMTAWSSPQPSFPARGGTAESASSGTGRDGEDATAYLSLPMTAFRSPRPEKISPSIF